MAKLRASRHPAAITTAGDVLARTQDTQALLGALLERLHADGRQDLAAFIRMSLADEARGPCVRPDSLAPVLVARLRIDGRGELADALTSLLLSASVRYDPRFPLDDEDGGSLGARRDIVARLLPGDRAGQVLTGQLIRLRLGLIQRLSADGHRDLAESVEAAWIAFDAQDAGQTPPLLPLVIPSEPEDELARLHPAEVLAYATRERLRVEGREILAGTMMSYWLGDVAGPVAEPRQLVAALVARLRLEDREELAEEIDSTLSREPIDRDVGEILSFWRDEVAGPIIDAHALEAAMVGALRKEGREELANAVAARLAG